MEFLYFPEDKTEYIAGFIWFGIGCIAAVLATMLIKRFSDKELKKANLEEANRMELEKQGEPK
jgi:hypothetical protein